METRGISRLTRYSYQQEALTIGRPAGPIIVGQLAQMATGFTDTVMAGRISQVASDYVKAVSWELPAVIGCLALRFLSEGIGYTKPMMLIQLAGLIFNSPSA